MITGLATELDILLKSAASDIRITAGDRVAAAILKVRMRDINISPGFDGEYGKVMIWNEQL